LALAIFDLDNTLIAGDSDHAWGEFMVDRQMVDADSYREANDRFYDDYVRGELDLNAYLEFSLEPLTHYKDEELTQLHREFMQSVIEPMMLPKAKALLQQHRDNGDYLLIITSTNGFITEPVARALKVDHILATDAERVDGRYTGRSTGTPCFQEGKITRLQQWLKESHQYGFEGNMDGSYFYSDSINDLPLMAEVENPVAVDPDDSLRNEAEQRGWPIISLR
jgi:HAD superfamily hydrolase (TIGR01490 family)